MPYQIKKRKCKNSENKKGNFIITKKNNNKKISCHTNLQKAKQALKAKYVHENINFILERLLIKILCESIKNKKTISGSHPEESYHIYDDYWFDLDGLTTSKENRTQVKNYLKSMKLL